MKPTDVLEPVHFEVDKNAFRGPFTCHNRKTKKKSKTLSVKGIAVTYEAWVCSKCGKEYLDPDQSKRLERIWLIEKVLEDDLLTMERAINFDGRTHFIRFPVELTKNWDRPGRASIKVLTPRKYLVEIQ